MKNKLKNNSLYLTDNFKLINSNKIDKLKSIAINNQNNRSRYCIHKSINSNLHQMIICLSKKTKINKHKHTSKDETICIIEGKGFVNIYDKNLKLFKKIKIDKNNFIFVKIPKNTIHSLQIDSKYLIILETTKGPFRKKHTVYY